MQNDPPLSLRLTKIEYASADTNFYTFADPQGASLPSADAGAHISLELANGLSRQYSLVHPGDALREYVIGVKRDPQSRGGSSFIHEKLRVGDMIQVAKPLNNFPLEENAENSVLFAGGIGVTPISCMAERLAHLGKRPKIYAAFRSRDDVLLEDELARHGDLTLHLDQEAGTVLPIAKCIAESPRDAHFYCCGPKPMIEAFLAAAAADNRPDECVHVEYFEATEEIATEGGFTVVLTRSGMSLPVPHGKTILQVVQGAGVPVAARCQEGVCGACETRVIEGLPDHRDAILTPKERKANATMMICCSGSLSDRLVLDL